MNRANTMMQPSPRMTVVHLSKAFAGRFPEVVLRDLGFDDAGNNWGNQGQQYHEKWMGGAEIFVVDFNEVWICMGAKYRQLPGVKTIEDLKSLIKFYDQEVK